MVAFARRGVQGALREAAIVFGAGSCLCLAAGGCEFKVPSPTYIHQTKLISVQAEVVELGPLNPGRLGVPLDAPMAEPMPYDRFAFDVVVVNPDGDQLGPGEVESIWFQCDLLVCGARAYQPFEDEGYDLRCDELEDLTMDDRCRLGEGDTHFEFEVPELGELMIQYRVVKYYGVMAWNGRHAEDCWSARRALDSSLDEDALQDCGFIVRSVKVGPSWWMLAYGDSIGLDSPIPLWQLPAPVYLQAANRTPSPIVDVIIDGASAGVYPDVSAFEARPGSTITLVPSYDPIEQFNQSFFLARQDQDTEKFWFQPSQEFMIETPYTTRAVHGVGDFEFGAAPLDFVVDEYADPGTSSIFLVYGDDRFGEGVARFEFEVGS